MIREWFEMKELVGVGGLPTTVQGITKKAKLENWQRRRVSGVKGNVFEYYVGDMPVAVQQALGFSHALIKEPKKPIQTNQDDLQKRIDQLENKLQALETKTEDFIHPKPPEGVNNEEWRLVCYYRQCDKERQAMLLSSAESLAAIVLNEKKEKTEPLEDSKVA